MLGEGEGGKSIWRNSNKHVPLRVCPRCLETRFVDVQARSLIHVPHLTVRKNKKTFLMFSTDVHLRYMDHRWFFNQYCHLNFLLILMLSCYQKLVWYFSCFYNTFELIFLMFKLFWKKSNFFLKNFHFSHFLLKKWEKWIFFWKISF